MYKRKIYSKIKEWKTESNGKTALLIEGARRIGKSTVVENFVKNEYKSYIFIDFSTVAKKITNLFEDISDLNFLFLQLQMYYQVDLIERDSCIVFDEVQLCPKARQAIKSLVKDGRYDYIETGSLISIRKNVKDILIPSEERKIQMYPMDYEEFCWALGDNTTIPILNKIYSSKIKLGDSLNREIMRKFRLYMLIGGMPQAISEYIQTNNFRKVDEVKRSILDLYEEDFRKIDPSGRISMLFDAIPAQLSNHADSYSTSIALKSRNTTENTILTLIAELNDSKTIHIAYHANNPEIGLSAYKDLLKFKLYLADTGLFVTLMFKDKDFTENIIYEKLLSDKLPVNLGYVYENVVAQILATNGNKLYYHTFYNQIAHRNYEIDFILSQGNKISPIEVKSSTYRKHSSLDAFSKKYSNRILNKYIIHTKDFSKDEDILCYPVYMTQFIARK